MSNKNVIVCEVSISKEDIKNLLISALEGGSNYWYMIQSQSNENKHPADCIFSGGFVMIDDEMAGEPELKKPVKLNMEACERGLRLMATSDEGMSHFADILSEATDRETADVFLQFCIFGQVIYG